MRYPADPPTVEEIVAVMRAAGERSHGHAVETAPRIPDSGIGLGTAALDEQERCCRAADLAAA
jgi:hypothetical protein